jgi:hypothetical protein
MMKSFRDHLYKYFRGIIMKKLSALLVILILLTGCSKQEGIIFCEGVDNSGKGAACGKKFTTGEMTAVIQNKSPFDADTLQIRVISKSGTSETVINTLRIEVEREKSTASFNLPLYNEGAYRIEALKDDVKIAEGNIEVIDTY